MHTLSKNQLGDCALASPAEAQVDGPRGLVGWRGLSPGGESAREALPTSLERKVSLTELSGMGRALGCNSVGGGGLAPLVRTVVRGVSASVCTAYFPLC